MNRSRKRCLYRPDEKDRSCAEIVPVEVRSHVSRPRLVRSAIDVVFDSRINKSAAPRVALPHASSVEPLAFQNIKRATASSQSSITAS